MALQKHLFYSLIINQNYNYIFAFNSVYKKMTFITVLVSVILFFSCDKKTATVVTPPPAANNIVQFVFTSDQHYGLTKTSFQGASGVDARIVNATLVAKINSLPLVNFPNDGGVKAGQSIRFMDYVISAGDIANREETGIQAATNSWNQFVNDYVNGITLKDQSNNKTTLCVVPGNHDVSNAIGYYKSMLPPIDTQSMIGMYNLMLNPAVPKTLATFNYTTDKVHYSKDLMGIHFMFLNLWPDSSERVWMTNDLAYVNTTTPVFLFAHSIPDVEARFFTNPNGSNNINATDKFENPVPEKLKDGALTINDPAVIEQRAFVNFLKSHTNIKAYFHGHSNFSQYYTWQGPDNNIALNCIRADSPMKGALSVGDETKLSFQVVAIDMTTKNITVRECQYNPIPANPAAAVSWGGSVTFSLN